MASESVKNQECLRCGSCCDKGGPAFHVRDRHLIENKIIAPKYIYTIRKGEPARDNVGEKLIFVESDIIKIKGREGSWRCVFIDAETKLCGIYENRPFECRALKCWDIEEIERSYSQDYLTREDLLASADGLWKLIQDHQEQCSYEKIRDLLKVPKEKLSFSHEEILKMIEADANVRVLAMEKMEAGFEWSEFLFGRPLIHTIKGFGLEVVKEKSGYILSPRENTAAPG